MVYHHAGFQVLIISLFTGSEEYKNIQFLLSYIFLALKDI